MAGKSATLAVKITGDASDARKAFADADDHANKFGASLGKMAGLVGGAFAVGAVIDFGKEALGAASDLEQAAGAVTSVFGEGANSVYDWGSQAADAAGLAESSYYDLANVLGSQLGNMGYSGQKLADQTNDLITLGSDLAAQFGGSTSDAVEALSSVFKGETDPIERYGVSIKQSDISARLAAQGQDKLTGVALKQATAQATLALVTEQTKNAQGQFAAQGNTAAEVQQKLGAEFENLKATVGGYLLPIFTALGSFLSGPLKDAVSQITSGTGPLGEAFNVVGGFINQQLIPAMQGLFNELAPKVMPILQTLGDIIRNVVVPAFSQIWSFIKDYAVPIIRAVLVPVLSGLNDGWHSVSDALERNRGKFQDLYEKVKPFLDFLKNDVAPFVGTVLKGAFEVLGAVMGKSIDAIAWILGKAGDLIGLFGKVGSFLFGGGGGGGGQAKPVGAGRMLGAAPGGGRLFGAVSSLGGGAGPSIAGGPALVAAGDTYNITVNGALDPVAVGRQVNDALRQFARSTGRQAVVQLAAR